MKKFNYTWLCLIALTMTLTSCEVFGDVLQAGAAIGVIATIAVVILVIWLVSKFRRK